jgi:large conductance mechanosensitive channel
MLKGFKDFLLRGNVIDLAVAVIIGAMFSAVVDSLVKGIIDPLLAGVVGTPNFDDAGAFAIGAAKVRPGMVLTALLNFALKAGVIYFFLVVPAKRLMEASKRKEAAAPPPPPTAQEKLLAEIRDLLKDKAAKV